LGGSGLMLKSVVDSRVTVGLAWTPLPLCDNLEGGVESGRPKHRGPAVPWKTGVTNGNECRPRRVPCAEVPVLRPESIQRKRPPIRRPGVSLLRDGGPYRDRTYDLGIKSPPTASLPRTQPAKEELAAPLGLVHAPVGFGQDLTDVRARIDGRSTDAEPDVH